MTRRSYVRFHLPQLLRGYEVPHMLVVQPHIQIRDAPTLDAQGTNGSHQLVHATKERGLHIQMRCALLHARLAQLSDLLLLP